MATPKSKTSKARTAQRRSHDALSVMPCTVCKVCGEKKRPHHIVRRVVQNNNNPGINGRTGRVITVPFCFFNDNVTHTKNYRN